LVANIARRGARGLRKLRARLFRDDANRVLGFTIAAMDQA